MKLDRATFMHPALCIKVGLMSILRAIELPEMNGSPINRDCGAETMTTSANPKESRSAVFIGTLPILNVYHGGDISKIRPAVIRRIAINVVDVMLRPLASHVEPCKPVPVGIIGIGSDVNVAVFGNASGLRASEISTHIHSPGEKSRIRVVMQKLAQTLRSKIGLSHDALQKLIGQRPASVESAVRASLFYRNGA